MAKFNNKGFFLVETIVITGVITAFLVIFYFQISNLYHNYERNAKFNSVDAIHAAYGVKTYLDQTDTSNLISAFNSSGQLIYEITRFTFDTTEYYPSLLNYYKIEKIYISQYNINDVVTNYALYDIDAEFLDYIRTLKVNDSKDNTYRIIIILKNSDYGSVLIRP